MTRGGRYAQAAAVDTLEVALSGAARIGAPFLALRALKVLVETRVGMAANPHTSGGSGSYERRLATALKNMDGTEEQLAALMTPRDRQRGGGVDVKRLLSLSV